MKVFLGLICASAFLIAVAQAQTSSSSTTTSTTAGGTTDTTTTTTETTGTINDFTPGSQIVLTTSAGAPATYKFHKTVTYVTADGKVIEASKIKKNSKVKVHYVKEGPDMLVNKVVVTE